MLLLLLSCANEAKIDSVGEPDVPAAPAAWRQAELRCEGDGVKLQAWTTAPASTATLAAAGILEDDSPTQASASLLLSSQDTVSGVQAWSFSGVLEALPCGQIQSWQLSLLDARGALLHCMDQDADPC